MSSTAQPDSSPAGEPLVPLHADTLAGPDKLLASLRSLLAPSPAAAGKDR